MPKDVAFLIERSLVWEGLLSGLYHEFARSFPAEPTIAAFWLGMAQEEEGHRAIIRRTRSVGSTEWLSRSLTSQELELIESVEQTIASAQSCTLATLDDAYELAHEMEASEINAVFQYLSDAACDAASRKSLAKAQLEVHLRGLEEFGQAYNRAKRRSIPLCLGESTEPG